jgi:glycosyltransferase involved in cell wall biosynthesis
MIITAHCIVKNEENYVGFAIRSVIDFVDYVLVFDTGSSDATVSVIEELTKEFPHKISFEQKGVCDKKRHTELRQEMVRRTMTDWFMILDGDEVWTVRALSEAKTVIEKDLTLECLIAPFYLCVGDIYHYSSKGAYTLRGVTAHATPRFFRRVPGMRWSGEYNHDAILDGEGNKVFEKSAVVNLTHKFWHLTHLQRSSKDDEDYSSGSIRKDKRRLTYFWIGHNITEPIPEVFVKYSSQVAQPLSFLISIVNFFRLARGKLFSGKKYSYYE